MNIHWRTAGAISLALATLCLAGSPARARDGETPGAAEQAAAVPASAPEILQAIDAKSAQLQHAIQTGALGQVHHLAYAIRDLAAALPSHSPNLAADKLAAVKGEVKFVATLAERLDASGDANDKATTQANYEKLAKVIATIHSNYAK
jgi:hypothetical protein